MQTFPQAGGRVIIRIGLRQPQQGMPLAVHVEAPGDFSGTIDREPLVGVDRAEADLGDVGEAIAGLGVGGRGRYAQTPLRGRGIRR